MRGPGESAVTEHLCRHVRQKFAILRRRRRDTQRVRGNERDCSCSSRGR